ncbi:MAG: AAA family ATPase [Ramlibacter sp.]|uniref:replicative DNA helicase n=1 Tax=Variovorax sp. RTB1 TaxID=3048631 RepID=UPI001985514C|nr:DnaB-like helicase C-terminal domain-containing protein [Variovorax sp. RTB1]MBC7603415.1 AAA family ATPase [Ramlibacter sp.]MEB0112193.1 DnaB-like helicase C-terminal domain-containing protein [Variovorax sp. RTB1]
MKCDRLPELPHSAEAQDAIIGALMSDGPATQWIGALDASAFYDSFNAAAFRSIQVLSNSGRPIDPIATYEQMRYANPAIDIGAMKTLHELANWRVTEKQFRNYVRIVIDHQRLRELNHVGTEIAALGLARDDPDKQIDAAQMMLAKLAIKKGKREPEHIHVSLESYLGLLADMSQGKNPAMRTGLGGLDRILNGGVRRGEMMVIGARPKHGKTALALAMARFMARENTVLFLSQEMGISQLMHRHTAAMGNFDLAAILRADPADQAMWEAVAQAACRLGELHLVHDDHPALNLRDVRRKAIKVKREHGLGIMFVDFLQLMAGAGEESRNRELDVIANGIKSLAMELDIAVVVLSQMSREADKIYGRPAMTHLRDSGAIEAAADQVALLFTDWAHPMSKRQAAMQGFSELDVVAHRNGPQGLVPLRFVGRYQQFSDWTDPKPTRSGKAAGDFE